METYIVFDNKGVIHESSSYDDAIKEFDETKAFEGDLVMCVQLARRK